MLCARGHTISRWLTSARAIVAQRRVMHERVLEPLGMTDAAFHAVDIDRLCTAYNYRDSMLVVGDPPDGQWALPAFPVAVADRSHPSMTVDTHKMPFRRKLGSDCGRGMFSRCPYRGLHIRGVVRCAGRSYGSTN
jgi:CubicO group peptidase (beta-lactamase class C family)